jgi:hypothetical protein
MKKFLSFLLENAIFDCKNAIVCQKVVQYTSKTINNNSKVVVTKSPQLLGATMGW